jgi:hypothetical protein
VRIEFISWFATIWNASVSRMRYSPRTRETAGSAISRATIPDTTTATATAGHNDQPAPLTVPSDTAPATAGGRVRRPAV